MVRPRSGPTLTKFTILTVVLVGSVLVYRMLFSTQLDLIAKQSYNRVYYERMYADVSDEVADWRQRYDGEFARAEEHLKSLNESQSVAKKLQEDNEILKAELGRLQQQVRKYEGSRIL